MSRQPPCRGRGFSTDDRLPMRPLRRAIIQAGRMLPPLRRALADALLDDGPVDPTPLQRLRRGFEVLKPRPRRYNE